MTIIRIIIIFFTTITVAFFSFADCDVDIWEVPKVEKENVQTKTKTYSKKTPSEKLDEVIKAIGNGTNSKRKETNEEKSPMERLETVVKNAILDEWPRLYTIDPDNIESEFFDDLTDCLEDALEASIDLETESTDSENYFSAKKKFEMELKELPNKIKKVLRNIEKDDKIKKVKFESLDYNEPLFHTEEHRENYF